MVYRHIRLDGGHPVAVVRLADVINELYVNILKAGGTLAVVGMPAAEETPSIGVTDLCGRYLTTSIISGTKETQEVVDYSVAHGIYPETVVIPAEASAIDKAYQNAIGGKAKFRYVIDMQTIGQ